MNIEGIVLVRIDDRLIHGQVMTSWLNYTGANKIMIIDDGVAADPFMKSVLKTCVPANVKLATFNVERAATRLMKEGFVFSEINIGGMGVSGDRKKFFRNISASEEEKQMLKELSDAGSHITVRIIAEDSETDISKML